MLDTDTKRRIDTARDILVGKVPDPKSQVEQITIALIYKFMDDMDAKIVEILRVVADIHTHSQQLIERCYRAFLNDNYDSDEREYPDAADQIREMLIHGNYYVFGTNNDLLY